MYAKFKKVVVKATSSLYIPTFLYSSMAYETSVIKRRVKVHIITHVKSRAQTIESDITSPDDAKEVSKRLLTRISAEGIIKVYRSSVVRAIQTADVIEDELKNVKKTVYAKRNRSVLRVVDIHNRAVFDKITSDSSIPETSRSSMWIDNKIDEKIVESPKSVLQRIKRSLKFPSYLNNKLNEKSIYGREIDFIYVTHRGILERLCAELMGETVQSYLSQNGRIVPGDIISINFTEKNIILPNGKKSDINTNII